MASLVDEDGVQIESQAFDRIPPGAFKLVRRAVFAHLMSIGWSQEEIATAFYTTQQAVSLALRQEKS